MREFKGRVTVTTGAASGIGLALAERLGAEGMLLMLADIEEPALERAAARLTAAGYSAAAMYPIGRHAPCCCSKAAVASISECLLSELRAENAPIGVSDRIQGAGIAPAAVAERIVESIREDRFWIMTRPGTVPALKVMPEDAFRG